MSFLDNPNIQEDEKRNVGFQSIVAVRESVSLARRQGQPIPYRSSLSIISDLDENYHDSLLKYVLDKNESETVRLYKEKAELASAEGNYITPQQLLKTDIQSFELLLNKSQGRKKYSSVRKQKVILEKALLYFSPVQLSEHKLIESDYFLADRSGYTIDKIYEGIKYKDYQNTKHRILRMRLLHPDKEEHVSGADLVYEQYNLKKNRVRIIFLQYKAWDTKKIYLDDRSRGQIDRMENNFCNLNICAGYNGNKFPDNFRFPFCTAFLRPTSRIYNSESKLITTGMHIPVCEVKKMTRDKNSISKGEAYFKNISHQIFDELFNTNMIGSKWIDIDEIEAFYKKINIESNLDRIRIYAQEFNDGELSEKAD